MIGELFLFFLCEGAVLSKSTPLQDEVIVILALCILAIWDNKFKFLSHPKGKMSLAPCWCYGFTLAVNSPLAASIWVSKTQKMLLHEASFLNEIFGKGRRRNSTIISKISMQCPYSCSQENAVIVKYNPRKMIRESTMFCFISQRLHYKQGLKIHVHLWTLGDILFLSFCFVWFGF